jgi:ankyrin repeat protein
MSKSKVINNKHNNTLLIDAVIEEDIDQVTKLLESQVIVDKMNNNGITALMEASHIGNLEIVKLLLSYNADPNLIDKNGFNSFVWAYKAKNFHIIKELLIKVKMWSSNKEFNKRIWERTMGNFELYYDVIHGHEPPNFKMPKSSFYSQQIRKNDGVVKYDSKIYEIGSVSESLNNCFDHNGEYFSPHDSSHWVKKKNAKKVHSMRKNTMEIEFNYEQRKFTTNFRQYRDHPMCAFCKREGRCHDCEPIKDKKAMNKIRLYKSPTKRFNNIEDHDF